MSIAKGDEWRVKPVADMDCQVALRMLISVEVVTPRFFHEYTLSPRTTTRGHSIIPGEIVQGLIKAEATGVEPLLKRESQRNGWKLMVLFVHVKYLVIMESNSVWEIVPNIRLKKMRPTFDVRVVYAQDRGNGAIFRLPFIHSFLRLRSNYFFRSQRSASISRKSCPVREGTQASKVRNQTKQMVQQINKSSSTDGGKVARQCNITLP